MNPLRARWPLSLALWALVLGQWLVLVHAVGHGAVAPAESVQRVGGASASASVGLLQVVTAHVDGSPACQLFDQLAQPAPLPQLASPALVAQVHASPVAPLLQGRPTELASAYRARAPPRLG